MLLSDKFDNRNGVNKIYNFISALSLTVLPIQIGVSHRSLAKAVRREAKLLLIGERHSVVRRARCVRVCRCTHPYGRQGQISSHFASELDCAERKTDCLKLKDQISLFFRQLHSGPFAKFFARAS